MLPIIIIYTYPCLEHIEIFSTPVCFQILKISIHSHKNSITQRVLSTATHFQHNASWRAIQADKSLARPGSKQATTTKLLQATQKNSEGCPSNQVSAAAMTSASDEKMATFQLFF